MQLICSHQKRQLQSYNFTSLIIVTCFIQTKLRISKTHPKTPRVPSVSGGLTGLLCEAHFMKLEDSLEPAGSSVQFSKRG